MAVGRLTSFLAAEELQPNAITIKPAPEEMGEETVIVRDATFSWNRHENKHALKEIDYTAYKGELSCVVGRVGAGKSSFLSSILGDLWKVKGEVEVRGTIAYASQQSWILNATVKENIVFGYRYDSEFYERTVKACALIDDFAQLPDGDETVVGERGISLSGGQKARVALARAVYARADIYLLDDVLSAVDSHVGRHIIDNVLGPRGLLSTKTRILATNAIAVLRQASYITLLKDAKSSKRVHITNWCRERGLSQTCCELLAMTPMAADRAVPARHRARLRLSSSLKPCKTRRKWKKLWKMSLRWHLSSPHPWPSSRDLAVWRPFGAPALPASRVPAASSQTKRLPETQELSKQRNSSSRAKSSGLYMASTPRRTICSLSAFTSWLCLRHSQPTSVSHVISLSDALSNHHLGASVWLKEWSDENQKNGTNDHIGKFIGIYFVFGIGSSALTVVQTLILWIFCSIEVCRLRDRFTRYLF